MTTLRERLEEGEYKLVAEILAEKFGQIPLCCIEVRSRKSSLGKISVWVRCNWLKRWYTYHKFKEKCIECQEEMVSIIEHWEL